MFTNAVYVLSCHGHLNGRVIDFLNTAACILSAPRCFTKIPSDADALAAGLLYK